MNTRKVIISKFSDPCPFIESNDVPIDYVFVTSLSRKSVENILYDYVGVYHELLFIGENENELTYMTELFDGHYALSTDEELINKFINEGLEYE